jgi:chromosome segregation ATPase
MQTYPPDSGSSNLKTAVLAGAVIAMLAANVYLYMQVDVLKTDISKLRESVATEVANLRENSTATTATHRKSLDTLKSELEEARRQAAMASNRSKADAQKYADQLAKDLAAEQKKQEQQVASQFTEVKSDVAKVDSNANAKITEVNGEVTNVKSQVASTKSELEKTIGDLKKVTGDLGVQSGYIATNGKELAALKRFGERNYFEFNLAKT